MSSTLDDCLSDDLKHLVLTDPLVRACYMEAKHGELSFDRFLEMSLLAVVKANTVLRDANMRQLMNWTPETDPRKTP